MKKISIFIFVLFFDFGFSQQLLKRITQTNTSTIVEFFGFRNGTNGNVIGHEFFDVETSTAFGELRIYHDLSGQFGPIGRISCGSYDFNENICNGVFSKVNGINWGFSTNFNSWQNSNVFFLIKPVTYTEANLDSTNDADNLIDLLYYSAELPNKMDDNSPIPVDTWLRCSSRIGKDGITGATVLEQKQIVFKFNGNNWVIQSADWTQIATPVIPDVCGFLTTSEIDRLLENTNSIYPNPTENSIIIQNNSNLKENIDFEIVDITGKILIKGRSKFNEQINVEYLEKGSYIIRINNNEEVITKKFIKK
jgi:hypothetical protein